VRVEFDWPAATVAVAAADDVSDCLADGERDRVKDLRGFGAMVVDEVNQQVTRLGDCLGPGLERFL
jgi:hypothetical protein